MISALHEMDHLGEAIETRPLDRPQWIRFEERHHSFGQLLEPSNAESLTITVIHGDLAAPKTLEAARGGQHPFDAAPRGTLEGLASQLSSWAAD